jgi:hypothetical protein
LFKSAPSFKFIEADSIAPRSGNTLCKDNGYSKCLNAFRLVLVYNYDSTNAQCGGSTQSINRYIEPVSCSYEESNLFTTCQGNAAPPGKTYVEPLKGDSNSQGRIMQAICYN